MSFQVGERVKILSIGDLDYDPLSYGWITKKFAITPTPLMGQIVNVVNKPYHPPYLVRYSDKEETREDYFHECDLEKIPQSLQYFTEGAQ